MVYNRVRPISSSDINNGVNESSIVVPSGEESNTSSSVKDFNDIDSISTVNLEESSYLKLKPFSRLDPTLVRLINFLKCFGILVNLDSRTNNSLQLQHQQLHHRLRPTSTQNSTAGSQVSISERRDSVKWQPSSTGPRATTRYLRVLITLAVVIITGEVVYDVNLRQSKLLAEQKRSTPLLTFVIVAYSWLTLVIPIFCDISLILIGPHLFRFYSRTTSTVCNGECRLIS